MTHVEDEVVVATHGRGVWSVTIPGLAGGQTFKPLLGTMAQGPDGMLAIPVTLRGLYDSTTVAINDTPFVRLGPNPVAMVDTIIRYPVTAARTITVSATSYKAAMVYAAIPRSVSVILIASPQASYTNTFNTPSSDFTGTGFSITTPAGFPDGGIHTAHPYANNLNNTYMLTIPITVASTNAFLGYDDVALVEPGEPGAPFGDPNFYDYVVVEASRDGTNWIPVADGYDARYDSVWLDAFNAGTPGNATMFRHHEVNLLTHFTAGEIILIRIRLYTDPGVTGWGWAVDNLEIQQHITSAGIGNSFPSTFALEQNYPNPFNPSTTIRYRLPVETRTTVRIYDVTGRLVRTLVDEPEEAGTYAISWDGRSDAGLAVSTGVYVYRLQARTKSPANEFTEVKKMLLLK
jgi:hypothetical protein